MVWASGYHNTGGQCIDGALAKFFEKLGTWLGAAATKFRTMLHPRLEDSMKPTLTLLLLLPGLLFAQGKVDKADKTADKALDKPQAALLADFRALELKEDTTAQLETLVAKYRDKIAIAEADIAVLKAQLAKALLPPQPDREEIKRLVRKSADVEVELRLAQIDRQIDLRNALGDRKWQQFNTFLRDLRDFKKSNPKWAEKGGDKLLARNLVLMNDLLP
jgi:hypothetical protein